MLNIEQEVKRCVKGEGILPFNRLGRRVAFVLKKDFKYTTELLVDYIIRTGNRKGVWLGFDEEISSFLK